MHRYFSNFPVGRTAPPLFVGFLLFVSFVFNTVYGQPPIVSAALRNPVKAEVIGIQDGDTIELKYIFTGKKAGRRAEKPLRIRLLHVNCPERGAPFYKIAKQFTSQKCFGKIVQVKHEGKFDKYGRLLGEVFLPDGKLLNMELVKSGYAVHFKKYSTSSTYAELENQAKKAKLGIWGLSPQTIGKL